MHSIYEIRNPPGQHPTALARHGLHPKAFPSSPPAKGLDSSQHMFAKRYLTGSKTSYSTHGFYFWLPYLMQQPAQTSSLAQIHLYVKMPRLLPAKQWQCEPTINVHTFKMNGRLLKNLPGAVLANNVLVGRQCSHSHDFSHAPAE